MVISCDTQSAHGSVVGVGVGVGVSVGVGVGVPVGVGVGVGVGPDVTVGVGVGVGVGCGVGGTDTSIIMKLVHSSSDTKYNSVESSGIPVTTKPLINSCFVILEYIKLPGIIEV
jgi:hypothetical protein